MKEGNERAKLTFDMLCYQIKKYIGSYSAAMGGLNAIVFTAGIGEHTSYIRENALACLINIKYLIRFRMCHEQLQAPRL